MIDTIVRDARNAFRQIGRHPASYGVILLTLAVGLGAGTSMIAIANAVLIRPAFPGASKLVVLRDVQPPAAVVVASYPEYVDWKGQTRIFEGVGAFLGRPANLSGGGDGVERVDTVQASADVLGLAGVTPALGRAHRSDEDRRTAGPVALISDELWARRFARSPTAVGARLVLDDEAVTIVGVLPRGFRFLMPFDVWRPLGLDEDNAPRDTHQLTVLAAPRQDLGSGRGRAALAIAARNLQRDRGTDHSIDMTPLATFRAGRGRDAALLLLAAVAILGMIGCANVASLLLARGTARRGELAVRAALGASRRRLLGQLLTESVLLGLVGGGLGLLVALAGFPLVARVAAPFLPFGAELAVDGKVVASVLGLGLVSGLAFGLFPAWHAVSGSDRQALRSAGRGAVGGAAQARHTLIVVDFALAVLLLVGASLLGRSLFAILSDPRGFDESRIFAFRANLTGPRYEDKAAQTRFYHDGLAALRSAGFESVGAINNLPLDGSGVNGDLGVEGREDLVPAVNMRIVDTDYFRTLRIPLVRGRFFTDDDRAGAPGVAMVNASLAERLWPGENPVGKRIAFGWGMDGFQEVIGVVGDVRQEGPTIPIRPEAYVSLNQRPRSSMNILVRGAASTTMETVIEAARGAFGGIDPTQALWRFQTMKQVVDLSVSSSRASAFLVTLFAALALGLSVAGIAGVMASLVGQRRREIGVRMAMGATGPQVLHLVLSEGLRWAGTGVATGLVLAFALSPLLRGAVFGIGSRDPLSYMVAAAVLLVAAVAAILLPASRAARLDPTTALRQD